MQVLINWDKVLCFLTIEQPGSLYVILFSIPEWYLTTEYRPHFIRNLSISMSAFIMVLE